MRTRVGNGREGKGNKRNAKEKLVNEDAEKETEGTVPEVTQATQAG